MLALIYSCRGIVTVVRIYDTFEEVLSSNGMKPEHIDAKNLLEAKCIKRGSHVIQLVEVSK